MYKLFKRLGDILFALTGILVFLPFFIPLAIALRLTGEGYVFYRQQRVGYKNRNFRIWKFATMLKDSPSLGTGSITVKDDWRLTPLGKYLRGSKVNEIPQLLNILLGDMSVVGPRPLMQVDFDKYSDKIKEVVSQLKPGLTGIASIVFRDEESLYEGCTIDPHEYDRLYIAPYKGALEAWYRDHLSFCTDLCLILLTAWVIVYPKSRLSYKIFSDLPHPPGRL